MRMRVLGRKLAAISCGVVSAGALMVGGAAPVSGEPVGVAAAAELGLRFMPSGDAGQCWGYGEQWVPENVWTERIVVDTDGRPGLCWLALGLNDADGSLAGLNLTYRFEVSPNGNAGQCVSSTSQPVTIPPLPGRLFGTPPIGIDADNRLGWCDLTLEMSGRTDVALDVWFAWTGDAGQCRGSQPSTNRTLTAFTGPLVIGFDTDNRSGGCPLRFRIRHT
jgi:hypothetical protein